MAAPTALIKIRVLNIGFRLTGNLIHILALNAYQALNVVFRNQLPV